MTVEKRDCFVAGAPRNDGCYPLAFSWMRGEQGSSASPMTGFGGASSTP
jgi:hypothetical protein